MEGLPDKLPTLEEFISSDISEYSILPSKKKRSDDREVYYEFDADGVPYEVNIWYDKNMHAAGTYEVEFAVDGEESHHRVGKDLKHLNNVLYTVQSIVDREVKDRKIKNIKIEGAGGKMDSGGLFDTTLRSDMYLRFLKKFYPANSVSTTGRYINIDMTKAYPELFKGDISRVDQIVTELLRISDGKPDEKGIRRGVNSSDGINFTINTDFVDSKKHGTIYFEITSDDNYKEYSISWDMMEKGEEGEEDFKSYEDLLKFIKEFK